MVDADAVLPDVPVETRYICLDSQVFEEQDEFGVTLASYVYGRYVDEVLTMRRDVDDDGTPEDYYYHTDDLDNVMAITDETGTVVERYEYDDYGQPEFRDADGAPLPVGESAIDNPYLFTGRRFCLGSGFKWNR